MKRSNKIVLLMLMVFIMFTFTGCKGAKIPNDSITYKYFRDSQCVVITNNTDDFIYVKLNINFLDKNGNTVYEKLFDDRIEKTYLLNVNDIDISNNEIESIELNNIEIYKFSHIKTTLLVMFIMFVLTVIVSMYIIFKNKNYFSK